MCVFLSEKSTLFVVSGFAAQCRGPAFFLFMGGPQERVADRPRMGRGAARASCGQSNAERATRKGARKKGRKMFFRGKDWKDVCFALQVEAEVGAQLLRP